MVKSLVIACGQSKLLIDCVFMKQEGGGWGREWTAMIGQNLKRLRQRAGISAQDLSRRCLEQVGYEVPRNSITNLENGRKEQISVQEILTLAIALDLPPVVLLFPLDEARSGDPVSAQHGNFAAAQWFSGLSRADGAKLEPTPATIALFTLRDLAAEIENLQRWLQILDLYTDPSAPDRRVQLAQTQERIEQIHEQIRVLQKSLRAQHVPEEIWPQGRHDSTGKGAK